MQNDGNGHYTKYSDEKPRNSADDNSVIITYRKMSDKTDDDMNTETKDDDLDEEIYLRTLVILISSFYHTINWHLHYFLLFN